MHLIKSGSKYYTVKSGTKNYLWDGDYLIENGQLKWANPNIYLQYPAVNRNGYFDTGVYGNLNTEIQCRIERDTTTGRKSLWGYGSSSDVPNTISMYSDGKANCRFSNKTTPTSLSIPMEEKIVIKQNKTALYFNDVVQYTYNATTQFTTSGTLLIFQVGNVTYNAFLGKMYYFKIYDNGTLVRNFVPVPTDLQIGSFTVPSNGMFDIVNQQFYPNQSTGTFTYGKDA